MVELSWLTRLFNVVWRPLSTPVEWQTRVVVPIFKKGDWRVCSSYREITLLSVLEKVLSRVLERRQLFKFFFCKMMISIHFYIWSCIVTNHYPVTVQLSNLKFRRSSVVSAQVVGQWTRSLPLQSYLGDCGSLTIQVCRCFVDLEKTYDHFPQGVP